MKLKFLLRGIPTRSYIPWSPYPVIQLPTVNSRHPLDLVIFLHGELNNIGRNLGLRNYNLKRVG